MENVKYHVLGVMSGTSLDGIDLCYVRFDYNGRWKFKILASETVKYTQHWKDKLSLAIRENQQNIDQLNEEYTIHLGDVINRFLQSYKLKDIDAICSHGHTIFHEPENGLTLQIGNLPKLAKIVQTRVVCDFRVQDVALGGQGAPLVPIGDKLLFNDYDFCINLGGFANISSDIDGSRIAYDICPVNIVLNHYVKQLGKDFDDRGQIASKGELNPSLLESLNSLEFYAASAPKSLGLEWVMNLVFPLIDTCNLSVAAILRTFIEHAAIQISRAVGKRKDTNILFTGGGVYNKFLMDRISNHITGKITIPENEIVEYKEALIFGLLGVLKLRKEVNCLSSVTGAAQDHSSGNIFLP